MKHLFIFLVISCAVLTANCCYHGELDTIKRYPFMASLKYDGNHTCSAVILTKYLALTAANCIHGRAWPRFSISVGKTQLEEGPGHAVFAAEHHNYYLPTTKDYDVGVVAFEKITFNETVKPLRWGNKPPWYQPKSVITAGWGLACNDTDDDESNYLQYKEGNLISLNKCREYYKGVRRLTARMFCTEANHQELCVAENGSPLLTAQGLEGVGIASIYGKCPQPDRPLVFMNINSLSIKGFIKQMIRKYKEASSFKADSSEEHEDHPISSKPSTNEPKKD